MNLFRSEEDIRSWVQFEAGTEEGIIGLDDLVKLFSGRYLRKRLDPDRFSHSREYVMDMLATLNELGMTGPFWKRPQ